MIKTSTTRAALNDVVLFRIEQANRAARQYAQREFDRLGLDVTVDQWVLMNLIDEGDGLTQQELAARSHRDPASITRTLALLDTRGFIERRPDERDARAIRVSLTDTGARFVESVWPVVRAMRKRSTRGFFDDELTLLTAMLHRVQLNFE